MYDSTTGRLEVTPQLKLELGVRETILQPYYALWGNYDVFDARFYDPKQAVSIDPRTGSTCRQRQYL